MAEYKYAIVTGVKEVSMADPLIKSLPDEHINIYNGANVESFSKMINECILLTEGDFMIFCSHRVRPTKENIHKMLHKLQEGYGLVLLKKMACFGVSKQLIKQIGFLDERFKPAGFEDNDFYIRVQEANIAVYEEECVEYIGGESTWQQELYDIDELRSKQPITYFHWNKKWLVNEDHSVTRLLQEQNSTKHYKIGELKNYIKFKPFSESKIETSYLFATKVHKFSRVENKRILIIGGTGILGKKIIDLMNKGNDIHVYSRDENKHWHMKSKYKDSVKYIIGDIRDYSKIESTITRLDPNVIIIASALKHIDTCEYEVHESLETNTNGTLNVLRAIECNVRRLKRLETVIFISTDKACYPINTYGMCKALSEKAIVEYSLKMNQERVKFINVRYGNVLNSRGSIIPKLKESKEDTLYLTHPDMTRFIMTQEDSVNLIQYAIINGDSGDTIIPRIEAMRIKDLFELFVEQQSPPKKIEITSLRAGEKMSEALLNINEIRRTVCKDNYYIIKPDYDTSEYEFIKMTSYDSSDTTLDKKDLQKYLQQYNFL